MSKFVPLARPVVFSKSFDDARRRVLLQYRHYLKETPVFCRIFVLDFPPSVVRHKIRQEFEKNRYVEDLSVINVLLLKGHQEFQELRNLWKNRTHAMRYFREEEASYGIAPNRTLEGLGKNSAFLERFLEGKPSQ